MAKSTAHNRSRAMKSVHKKYRRDQAGLNGLCVYCGKRADSEDHVPPVSIAADLQPEYLAEIDPVLVPACRHCNSILGASLEMKLVDRRDIVADYLATKKRRMLDYGKTLYEKKLPVFDTFRDIFCLEIYERWLFASVTTNEVGDKPVEEETEEFERENFEKNDLPEMTISQYLMTWGLSQNASEHDFAEVVTFTDFTTDHLSAEEKGKHKIAEFFYPVRGPYNWSAGWLRYLDIIKENSSMHTAIVELLETSSSQIITAHDIYSRQIDIFNKTKPLAAHIKFSQPKVVVSFDEEKKTNASPHIQSNKRLLNSSIKTRKNETKKFTFRNLTKLDTVHNYHLNQSIWGDIKKIPKSEMRSIIWPEVKVLTHLKIDPNHFCEEVILALEPLASVNRREFWVTINDILDEIGFFQFSGLSPESMIRALILHNRFELDLRLKLVYNKRITFEF